MRTVWDHNLQMLLSKARYEDLRREAEAERLAAAAARSAAGHGAAARGSAWRRRLGLALVRLGSALAGGDVLADAGGGQR